MAKQNRQRDGRGRDHHGQAEGQDPREWVLPVSAQPGPIDIALLVGAGERHGAAAAVRLPAAVHHLHTVLTLADVPAGRGIELGPIG
jgi:hypothetical protein